MPNPDEKDIVDETAAVVERLRIRTIDEPAAARTWRAVPDPLCQQAADLLERLSRERGTVPEGAAYWTHEECDAAGHLYYFGIAEGVRTRGPYTNQRHVDAIIDIASDGTLAGVELIDNMPPPPLSAAPQPPSVSSEIERLTSEVEMWRQKVAEFAKSHERLQTELEKARDGMQNALADAIKDAISDLDDHAGDDLPTRRFLAGAIDGLKKALFIAVSASPVPQNGEG